MLGLSDAAEMSWRDIRSSLLAAHSAVEIARHREGARPASLNLLCSRNGHLLMLLSARLPGPRWVIDKGRDDHVSLFVDGIKQQLALVVDIVEKGRNLSWFEWLFSDEDAGEPDTIVTAPLSPEDLTKVGRWFDPHPPSKVSVVGVSETGVFMKGIVSGSEIREFLSSCISK